MMNAMDRQNFTAAYGRVPRLDGDRLVGWYNDVPVVKIPPPTRE